MNYITVKRRNLCLPPRVPSSFLEQLPAGFKDTDLCVTAVHCTKSSHGHQNLITKCDSNVRCSLKHILLFLTKHPSLRLSKVLQLKIVHSSTQCGSQPIPQQYHLLCRSCSLEMANLRDREVFGEECPPLNSDAKSREVHGDSMRLKEK